MSNAQYAINYDGAAMQSSAPAQEVFSAPVPIPHYYMARPRRSLSAVVQGFFVAAGTLGLVIGLEFAAPMDWKPSSLFGSYNGRLAAEIKAHEMETEARYQEWAQNVQVSVNQQVEAYRTKAQAVGGHYQAVMERAQMFAQSTARIQEAYVQTKLGLVRSQQTGDTTVVNFSRILGNVFSIFDPQSSEPFFQYADAISGRLQQELDAAAQSGTLIKIEGWDTNLPSPDQVQAELLDLPPVQFPPLPRMSRDARADTVVGP